MEYKYSTINEVNHFEFGEAVVGDIQLTERMFHLVLDNVKICPENSCNRDIRMMRTNELLFKISDAEIISLVEEGYNEYDADGNLKHTYPDTEIEKGNIYTYNVTAVFDKGESPYSNTVTVDRSQSGIDETSGNPIKVYAADHTIVIENVDNQQAEIFKIDGSKIFDEIISYKDRIHVETGIYIVRIDGKSFKVTVR